MSHWTECVAVAPGPRPGVAAVPRIVTLSSRNWVVDAPAGPLPMFFTVAVIVTLSPSLTLLLLFVTMLVTIRSGCGGGAHVFDCASGAR